jgi:monofunctional biosynthetic peptidoglycan transglycosylase
MSFASILRKFWRFLRLFIIFFLIFSIGGVIVYRFLPVPITPLMVQRAAEQLFQGKKISLKHKWVSIEKISPNMIQAAVAAEDNRFMEHRGIDYEAIKKAYKYNKYGKRIRGASTITQQTCKNVFLWQSRNYLRKGLEVYFSYLVEGVWGKKRIMEVYLNSIEMGDGIFGIEAASRAYFKKSASRLTRSEAALIAASFPNPRKRNPSKPNSYLIRHQQRVLVLMDKIGRVEL